MSGVFHTVGVRGVGGGIVIVQQVGETGQRMVAADKVIGA